MRLEETFVVDGHRYELGSSRYLLESSHDPFPRFVHEIEGVTLTKTVFLVHGEDTVVVRWELGGDTQHRDVRLEVRPLLAFRDDHALALSAGRVTVTPYEGLPSLTFAHDAAEIASSAPWHRGCGSEDLFSPFRLLYRVSLRGHATLVAGSRPRDVADVPALLAAAEERGNTAARRGI